MRGRLAMVLKRAPLRFIFGVISAKNRGQNASGNGFETLWLSPAKRDRVVPCLDLENETG